MRKKLIVFGVVSAVAMLSSVNAATITSITTSDGVTTTVSNGEAGSMAGHVGAANLLQFTADGVVYESITAGTGADLALTRIWERDGTDPGDNSVVADLNLATGSLNGGNTVIYDLSGLTLDASSTLFLFSNGGSPVNNVTLKDSGGVAISTAYTGTDFGGADEVELGTINHDRDGNALNNRVTQGFTFSAADFTFAAGKSITDAAGFSISSTGADISDFGSAIPEPSTLGLLGLASVGLFVIRRRSRM